MRAAPHGLAVTSPWEADKEQWPGDHKLQHFTATQGLVSLQPKEAKAGFEIDIKTLAETADRAAASSLCSLLNRANILSCCIKEQRFNLCFCLFFPSVLPNKPFEYAKFWLNFSKVGTCTESPACLTRPCLQGWGLSIRPDLSKLSLFTPAAAKDLTGGLSSGCKT